MRIKNATPARDRLIEAAARVFSREGLAGSTTRLVAYEADVSEVTLFRFFGTKSQLIDEIVGRVFPRSESAAIVIACSSDLRADLTGYARLYAQRLAVAMHKSRRSHHIPVDQLGDMLNGMLFSDSLRRASPEACPSYSFEQAVEMAVDLVVCAIDPRKALG